MAVALGSKLAALDSAAEIEDRERREAQPASDLGSPDRGLQRHWTVIAGESSRIGKPIGRINLTQVENEFRVHGLKSLTL